MSTNSEKLPDEMVLDLQTPQVTGEDADEVRGGFLTEAINRVGIAAAIANALRPSLSNEPIHQRD